MKMTAAAAVAANTAGQAIPAGIEIQRGPFSPSDSSLEKYACPKWFHDAKFGIWAHWGPQSNVGAGDWYARNMYMEGSRQYKFIWSTTATLPKSDTKMSSQPGKPSASSRKN